MRALPVQDRDARCASARQGCALCQCKTGMRALPEDSLAEHRDHAGLWGMDASIPLCGCVSGVSNM
jgi:hypothetical protein